MRGQTSSAVLLVLVTPVASRRARRGPHGPPADVPATPRGELPPCRASLHAYLHHTQHERRSAATQASSAPNQNGSSPQTAHAVHLGDQVLADAVKTQVRPDAPRGQICSAATSTILQTDIGRTFASPRADLHDELAKRNEGSADAGQTHRVNESRTVPALPPLRLSNLPTLPKPLAYDFTGWAPVLREVDANIVDTLATVEPAGQR